MSHKQETIDRFDVGAVGRQKDSDVWRPNHSMFQKACKRTFDICAALTFFVMFGWLYVVLWICVLITTGSPGLFKHSRVGRDGKEFNCLKFRSMVSNSAEILKKHLEENPDAQLEWEKDFKLRDDPRVTKFGKFIRKTSLDELPQFWNVLRGDMSLVGPRPVIIAELKKYYKTNSNYYVAVKPGITGPWQVGGRNDLDYDSRIRLDVDYAVNWSISADVRILIKTVVVVLARRGSY